MDAMSDLYGQYPNDTEVAAFYALSMLSASTATQDLTQRLNVRAGTITLNLFEHNPDHPGAAHYTIHAFDSPMLAPLSLQAAYRFSEIAPAVAHAVHMPTHIFIQHGMWDRVSSNNESAYTVARELWRPDDPIGGEAFHPLDWGQYGDLQLGDYARARKWTDRLESMAFEGAFLEGGPRGAPGQARVVNNVPLLRARYVVETEEWAVRPITDESSMHELLATGDERRAYGRPGDCSPGGGRAQRDGRPGSERKHNGPHYVEGGRRAATCRDGTWRRGDRPQGRGAGDRRRGSSSSRGGLPGEARLRALR